jgi:tRNA nucleotidyltransferase (CCA-adding enzyme)
MLNQTVHQEILSKLKLILQSEVYLVGGSVRDLLIGHEPKDFDFCTSLLPDEVEARVIASGHKAYTIGKKFGTIGMKLSLYNNYYYIEITTFRGEKYDQVTKDTLSKSRKPTVHYVQHLQEDLSRRDFTINAMAMDSEGVMYDFFGGKDDIKMEILKCVGNPKLRFKEDPLRILRAIRFAGKYNLTIEGKTWDYIGKLKFELLRISKERIVMELDKIIGTEHAITGLNLLMDSGVLGIILPELTLQKDYDQNSPYHDFNLWDHTCKIVANCPANNIELRWAALLHDIAKPFTRTENTSGHSNYINHDILGADMSLKVSTHLKFSNTRRDFIFQTIRDHLKPDSILKPYDDAGKKVE